MERITGTMPAMRSLAAIAALLVAGCAATDAGRSMGATAGQQEQAGAGDDAFQLDVFRWDGPLTAEGAVRVRNPYGDIRARASGEDKLIVSAQVQTFTDWQAAPVFDVVESDGVTEVRIEHEHPVRAPYLGDYSAGFAGRVDIALLLPDGARLDATTTDGALRVKGFTGALEGRTGSGEIYYKSNGPLDLETGSGAVEAIVRNFDEDVAMRIFSVSGPVHLRMTPEVSALVVVTTAGPIETDIMDGVVSERRRLKDGYEIALGKRSRIMRVGSRTGAVKVSVDRSFSIDVVDDEGLR